ncbi:uncharacterized protein LOC124526756 [Lynx rufus]|uniref:uncharacterized protein LOC124526756 n=1 Tax=Lynx rufus TaxID=61384 RepID=UPI001F1234B7|nr:uncharacterized protein LOC124526756 [Lynx rufus]
MYLPQELRVNYFQFDACFCCWTRFLSGCLRKTSQRMRDYVESYARILVGCLAYQCLTCPGGRSGEPGPCLGKESAVVTKEGEIQQQLFASQVMGVPLFPSTILHRDRWKQLERRGETLAVNLDRGSLLLSEPQFPHPQDGNHVWASPRLDRWCGRQLLGRWEEDTRGAWSPFSSLQGWEDQDQGASKSRSLSAGNPPLDLKAVSSHGRERCPPYKALYFRDSSIRSHVSEDHSFLSISSIPLYEGESW